MSGNASVDSDPVPPRRAPTPSPPPPLPPWHDRRLWQVQAVRDLFWIVVALTVTIGAIWLGYALRSIFTPVLVAFALAYLFQPIIRFGEAQSRFSRPVVVALLMLSLALVGLGLLAWMGPKFYSQLEDLARDLPTRLTALANHFDLELGSLQSDVQQWAEDLQADPGGFIVGALGTIFAGTSRVFGVIGQVIGVGVYVVMSLFLIAVYFFFFAWHFDAILRFFKPFIPANRRDRALELLGKMDQTVATFFRARVVIALIMGAMFSIGWAIVGVPYWFLLGMASGLLSLVPFASIVGWPLAVGLMWLNTLDSGGGETQAAAFDFWLVVFWPSFVYLVVQGMEGWLLTPVIQGRSLDMSIVTILIVVFVGGALGGLYGLILCIPLVACVKILLHEAVLPSIRTWAAEN
ncbi:MAG: AI-2E family transporter [Phycisphaeraceae bacterium]